MNPMVKKFLSDIAQITEQHATQVLTVALVAWHSKVAQPFALKSVKYSTKSIVNGKEIRVIRVICGEKNIRMFN